MKGIQSKSTSRRGFTLVELLVVIVIIAVLVTISVTMVFRFRKAADKTVSLGNLRQLQAANVSYAADHAGRQVSPTDTVVDEVGAKVAKEWWENPEFISQFTGGTVDVALPTSMMDPSVVREGKTGSKELPGSYAYNTQGMPVIDVVKKGYLIAQVADPARSAAFFTADFPADGVLDFASKSKVAYRHADKGLVVFYDSHAAPVAKPDVEDAQGGATGRFWDADPEN